MPGRYMDRFTGRDEFRQKDDLQDRPRREEDRANQERKQDAVVCAQLRVLEDADGCDGETDAVAFWCGGCGV